VADPSPGIRLTSSTQAALQRIATAPATSEQRRIDRAAQAVLDVILSKRSSDPLDSLCKLVAAAAIRVAVDQVMPPQRALYYQVRQEMLAVASKLQAAAATPTTSTQAAAE